MDFSHFDVPEFGSAIHRAGTDQNAMRIKRYGNNFSSMPREGSHLLSCDGAPNFGSVIKRASTNLISKRHIKSHTINGVFMSFKGMNKVSSGSVPEFAGTVITTSEKLISVLVEAAVGKGKHVAFESFH